MQDIEAAHVRAVNLYFDAEAARAERFLTDIWAPLFLRNFLGTSRILADIEQRRTIGDAAVDRLADAAAAYLTDPSEAPQLAEAVRAVLEAGRADEEAAIRGVVADYVPDEAMEAATSHLAALLALETPAQMIMEFAQAASAEIEARRRSLLEPIEAARADVLAGLQGAYRNVYAGQGVVTGRLDAAARRGARQARLVDALGGEGSAAAVDARLARIIAGFDAAFAGVESAAGQASAAVASGRGAAATADDVLDGLVDSLNAARAAGERVPSGREGGDRDE